MVKPRPSLVTFLVDNDPTNSRNRFLFSSFLAYSVLAKVFVDLTVSHKISESFEVPCISNNIRFKAIDMKRSTMPNISNH